MQPTIERIAHIQTGTADLHVQHVEGSMWPAPLWIFFGRQRIEGIPVGVFVIEHRDGLILVDTGLDPRVTTDPEFWSDSVTRTFMNNIFRFHIEPEDRLGIQLERAGYSPDQVNKAIITHLHFDHAGGIADIPNAELIVSKDAWTHMLDPHANRHGVLRRDIEIPDAKWRQIGFEPLVDEALHPFTEGHDVMGDGSIIVLPTPGHLDGSMSVFLRADPPILFVGDLCYRLDLLMRGQMPGTGNHAALAESWAKVRSLYERRPELLIVPSHDAAAAEQLRAHPLAKTAASRGSGVAPSVVAEREPVEA